MIDLLKKQLNESFIFSNIHKLKILERKVIILTLLGWTPTEIAKDFGKKRRYISAIKSNGSRKLRELYNDLMKNKEEFIDPSENKSIL